ncbi:MAG: DNRLRE domain-containing protein [Planctomycetales bacterium]|nr:DNRLRE domain-containing protein [Planctomycetales bacterium]
MFLRRSSNNGNTQTRALFRRELRRTLRLETLDQRMLLAANVLDDTFNLSQSSALNVLSNDTDGMEVQTVSSVNFDYDPATVDKAGNLADWFVPLRADGTTPQRSLIPRALVEEPPQSNFGDVDLWLDIGGTIDTSDDVEMFRDEGIVLASIRENIVPTSAGSSVNLSILSYNTEGTGNAWLSTVAAPQNDGESMARIAGALFPYASGWRGGSFNATGGANFVPGASGITVSQVGTGRYEVTVSGVADSFSDGYLFAISAQNSDNYSHTMPLGGDKWLLAHRDNSANFAGGEDGAFNLLYIPRSAQGLIGGHVNAESSVANPLYSAVGDFNIQRESDGFWRMSIPGHSPADGMLILETNDVGRGTPGNVYFSYEASGDDFLIRQIEGNTTNPMNDDFMAFFVPFENTLNTASPLSISALGTSGAPASGMSTLMIPLSVNADGTVNYDAGDAIRALGEGQTAVDTFVYTAADTETIPNSATATVTVNWVGANDSPEAIGTIPTQNFNEDEASRNFDLAPLFSDVDMGDVLTYTLDPGLGGVLQGAINGSTLTLGPAPDKFGVTFFTVTATDNFGASASITVGASVLGQDDPPRAVEDMTSTDKVMPIDIAAIANDFHPETTEFSVAAANIDGNAAATGNGDTVWSVLGSSATPNELTIQSAPNLGDVAVGRNSQDLSLADGVLLGTVRDNTSPFQTVNTYDAFGSYGFATDTGIGGGERNSPLGAGFFPFAEGWISGHVSADGTLLGGVGVTQSNITKLGTGLWEISVPGMNPQGAFFDNGMMFVMSGSNDDNIMSVNPKVFGGWEVAQIDSDLDASIGDWSGEDDSWSFVYVPGTTPGLIGGHYSSGGGGGFIFNKQYGGVTAVNSGAGFNVSVPNYTPNDGAMIAIVAESADVTVAGNLIQVPAPKAVFAVPNGNDFFIESRNSGTYGGTGETVYFMFLPFAQPMERLAGLDLSITSVSATSALGASVTINGDGTLHYDPSTGGSQIQNLGPGQSIQDTFTYTLSDARTPPRTSTGTVTVTVTGENQLPTAFNDTINRSESSLQGGLLTVLGNDVDPDYQAIFGTPAGIVSANLEVVDATSTWSVAQTGVAPSQITLGTTGQGQVEILDNGNPITRSNGVVVASIRQNFDGANTNFRFVQAYENGSGGTSLAVGQFGADAAANANVGVSYFRFADGWIGGHVDGLGGLLAGSGVLASDVVRDSAGRYTVTIPGVADATTDGFLIVIGNENADNVISTRAVPGTSTYQVAVRDNTQDFADGEDGGFSFLFIPRNAQNLVAGAVDAAASAPNSLSLGIGEFTLEKQAVVGGGNEWKLTIPGQSPTSGVLLLTNQDNTEIEDNALSYQDDGAGSFLIRSHDMPGLGRQDQPFTFAFIPFDNATQPVNRPLMDLLSIQSVDAASALGSTLSINPDGTILYTPGSTVDALYDGDTAMDSFSYTLTDAFGATSSATVTLNIAGVGQPVALVTSPGETYYAVGDAPIGFDSELVLQDLNTPEAYLNTSVLTVAITAGTLASDQLTLRNEGTGPGQVGTSGSDMTYGGIVIGTWSGGSNGTPLVLTFNSAATVDGVQAVARAVSFSNSDAAVSVGTRTVSANLVDANGRSAGAATKDLLIGLIRVRELQQNVDSGFGVYASAADIELSQITPDTPQPTGRVASDGLLVDWPDAGGTNETHVLLRFEDIFGAGPGQIPLGSIITSATLTLDTNNSGDGAQMHRLLAPFDSETATWNSFGSGVQADDVESRVAFDSQWGLEGASGSTGTGYTSVSVLEDLRAYSAGEANNGWAFLPWSGGTDGWGFTSSEAANPADRPSLRIEWLPAGSNAASFRQGVGGYTSAVDTEVRDNQADTDKSTVDTLFVDAPPPNTQTLLRFDDIIGATAGQIPAGATIVSAVLTLASTSSNAMGDGGMFFPMLTPWSDTDTWNTLVNGVSADGVEAASNFNTAAGNSSLAPNVQGGFNTFDVTADVQAWVNGSLANLGWAFLPWTSGTDGWGIRSSEFSVEAERPRLEVYWVLNELPVSVAGTGIMYSDSAFIGDEALAVDKVAYRAGDGVATFANYTSHPAGINSIVVDIANLAGTPTAADFTFKIGNDQNPASWVSAPAPSSVTVMPGAGVDGSARVSIKWPDNAIQNQWLEVTVLANANTGLVAPDVHYWGNQIGETGNLPGNTEVNEDDVAAVRGNLSGFMLVDVSNNFDVNRDKRVNAIDRAIVQAAFTSGSSLVLLNLASPSSSMGSSDDGLPTGQTGNGNTGSEGSTEQELATPAIVSGNATEEEETLNTSQPEELVFATESMGKFCTASESAATAVTAQALESRPVATPTVSDEPAVSEDVMAAAYDVYFALLGKKRR